jgi:hypothetical protein
VKIESPVKHHVYNNNKVKVFHNDIPFFYKIYNVPAMKMHQMATKIVGIVCGVLTDTIVLEGKLSKPKCNKDVGGCKRNSY